MSVQSKRHTIFLSSPTPLDMPEVPPEETVEMEELSPIIVPEPIIEEKPEPQIEEVKEIVEEKKVIEKVVAPEPVVSQDPPQEKPTKKTSTDPKQQQKSKPQKPKEEKGWVLPKDPIFLNQNPNHERLFWNHKSFGKQWGQWLLDFGRKEWWVTPERMMVTYYAYEIRSKLFRDALNALWGKDNYDGDTLMNACRQAYHMDYVKNKNYDLSQDVWLLCQKT